MPRQAADDEPVVSHDDCVSISTEHSLEVHARSKDEVVTHLNGLVDEVYRRVAKRGYLFRTVRVKIVRFDFSIETREVSFQSPQLQREAIASAVSQLANRFSFAGRAVRKVGLKVTNRACTQPGSAAHDNGLCPGVNAFSRARLQSQPKELIALMAFLCSMAAGAETVSDQDRLFYCDSCSMLFLSEGDAKEHKSLSGHSTVQPAVAQA